MMQAFERKSGKRKLLKLLDDVDVQTRLKAILLEGDAKESSSHHDDIISLQHNLDALKSDKQALQKQLANLQETQQTLQKNNKALQEENMTFKEALEKFKRLFGQGEQKTQQMQHELHITQQAKNGLLQDIQQAKAKQRKLETQKQSIETELQNYKRNFDELQTVYTLFTSLSPQTLRSIHGIFKDDSLQGFLAAGVQERNIDSLWDYIKNQIIEDNNKDTPKLIEMFDVLFGLYAKAYPHMEIQEINTGESFDPNKHIRTSGSQVSGVITSVVLHGWINSKTKKIINQSVVKV